MQYYWDALLAYLIPQVIAGLLGGFVGVWINSKLDVYGLRLTLLFGLVGMVASGAMAEFMYYEHHLKYLLIHCLLGVVTGIFGSSGIDALKIHSFHIVEEILNDAPKSLKEIIFSWLKKK